MPKKRGFLHNGVAARGEIVPSARRTIIQPRFWQRVAPRKRLRLTRPGALMSDMFYVYLLRSVADDGFYIGFSTDLKRRLSHHKQGASFATRHRGPGN